MHFFYSWKVLLRLHPGSSKFLSWRVTSFGDSHEHHLSAPYWKRTHCTQSSLKMDPTWAMVVLTETVSRGDASPVVDAFSLGCDTTFLTDFRTTFADRSYNFCSSSARLPCFYSFSQAFCSNEVDLNESNRFRDICRPCSGLTCSSVRQMFWGFSGNLSRCFQNEDRLRFHCHLYIHRRHLNDPRKHLLPLCLFWIQNKQKAGITKLICNNRRLGQRLGRTSNRGLRGDIFFSWRKCSQLEPRFGARSIL